MRDNNKRNARTGRKPNATPAQAEPNKEVTTVTQVDTVETETSDVQPEQPTSNGSSNQDLSKVQADIPGFRGPITFRMALEDAAREAKLPLATFIKRTLAEKVGITLPDEPVRGKMTEDERKAKEEAAKAKAKEERRVARELLKQHNASNQQPATA